MEEITKENILAAIKEIDQKGVPASRQSSFYDLIYEGKPYPPKLLISIANRYATGVELDPKTFSGGLDTPAFQLLEKEGFQVERKAVKITNFASLIIPLKNYLKNSDSIIANFTIGEHKAKAKWVWISDAVNIIGDLSCHYELIERVSNSGNLKKDISVEIHFEDKTRKKYFDKLKDNLPNDTYWNDKHQPKLSITYKNTFSYDDPDLLTKIEDALVYLEENLGDKIRKMKTTKYSIQQMEKMFKEYLEKVILKSVSNYLSAVPTITRIGLANLFIEESLYEIQDLYSFNKFLILLRNNTEYIELNKTGHL